MALVSEPGFMCREHTITQSKDHPLEKIDTIYARPVLADDIASGRKSYTLWTWSRQDSGRNFSIIDVRKGVFNIPKKLAPGGRVYSMTATGEVEKRIWIGTAVSGRIILMSHNNSSNHTSPWILAHPQTINY